MPCEKVSIKRVRELRSKIKNEIAHISVFQQVAILFGSNYWQTDLGCMQ